MRCGLKVVKVLKSKVGRAAAGGYGSFKLNSLQEITLYEFHQPGIRLVYRYTDRYICWKIER